MAGGAQQPLRRLAHLLRVREVARVVVGDAQRLPRRRRHEAELVEERADVDHAAGQLAGLLLVAARPANSRPYSRMPEPQPAALTMTASTSAGNAAQVAARELARLAGAAAVHGERAAAALAARHHGLDAVARQHAQRRPADVRLEHLLGAAGEQRDARAARALGREDGGSGARFGRLSGSRSSIGCSGPTLRRQPAERGGGAEAARVRQRAGDERALRALGERRGAARLCARKAVIRSPYSTPDGHAVTHAWQPRQLSIGASASSRPRLRSSTSFIRKIRPRGECGSSALVT